MFILTCVQCFCSFTVKVMGPKKGAETSSSIGVLKYCETGQCVKLVGKEHLFEINCCLRNFAWHLRRQLHRLKLRCWRAAKFFIKTKLSQIESMRWHFFAGNHEWLVNQTPLIPPWGQKGSYIIYIPKSSKIDLSQNHHTQHVQHFAEHQSYFRLVCTAIIGRKATSGFPTWIHPRRLTAGNLTIHPWERFT